MTWEEARKNCKNKSSELASILDAYSQSFLWLQILKYGEPVWIGLNSEVVRTMNTCKTDYDKYQNTLAFSIYKCQVPSLGRCAV